MVKGLTTTMVTKYLRPSWDDPPSNQKNQEALLAALLAILLSTLFALFATDLRTTTWKNSFQKRKNLRWNNGGGWQRLGERGLVNYKQ